MTWKSRKRKTSDPREVDAAPEKSEMRLRETARQQTRKAVSPMAAGKLERNSGRKVHLEEFLI